MNEVKKHARLVDYSDQELYEELQKNEHHDAKYLVFICSEVLRRMLEKQNKNEEKHGTN